MRFFSGSLLVVLMLCAGCASLGRRAALPGSHLKPPASTLSASSEYELADLSTSSGHTIKAQFGQALAPDGSSTLDWRERIAVVFCYGNRMSIAASQSMFLDLRRMGANVVVFDYPGYGMSPGTPSEEGCYGGAEAAYRFLVERKGIPGRQIVAAGLSLGCSVALELAARRETSGVILVVPFTRTHDVGEDHLSWYVRWAAPMLARQVRFDNLTKISRVSVPLLLVSASRDQLTSSQRTDQIVNEAARAQLTHIRIDADHDGAWGAATGQVSRWLAERGIQEVRQKGSLR